MRSTRTWVRRATAFSLAITCSIAGQAGAAPWINEILSGPPNFVNDPMFEDQYVELRGEPGTALPDGTYLVVVRGSGTRGDLFCVFDLAGLGFGSNGILALYERNTSYPSDPDAISFHSISGGFSGFGFFSADGSNVNLPIPTVSATYLLIQTDAPPVLTDGIDANADGTPDGTVYAGWTVLDGVSLVDASFGSAGYAPIVFSSTAFPLFPPGATVVFTPDIDFQAPGYAARIGSSTGSAAEDWVAAQLVGTVPDLTMANAVPSSFEGAPLASFGAPNPVPEPPALPATLLALGLLRIASRGRSTLASGSRVPV